MVTDNNSVQETQNGQDHGNESNGQRRNSYRDIRLAEWIMIVFTAVTALAAIGSLYVSRGQWQVAEQQRVSAEKAAADSAKETQAALAVSQRVAAATERQSRATEEALGVSGRMAGAAEAQANVAQGAIEVSKQQLAANREAVQDQRQGHIKITAEPIRDYKAMGERPVSVTFNVENVGATTIYDARTAVNIGIVRPDQIASVWNKFEAEAVETIPPGGQEPFRIMLPYQITDTMMQRLATGEHRLVALARVTFTNRGERRPQVRYVCYQYFGPPEAVQERACPTPSQRQR